MAIRLNLNTVDYSRYNTLELLAMLNNLRQIIALEGYLDPSYYDCLNKAEDMWSVLYERRRNGEMQHPRLVELFDLADEGELSDEDVVSLEQGCLP
jgi:hypothetical protein